jgi:hypothetical protein
MDDVDAVLMFRNSYQLLTDFWRSNKDGRRIGTQVKVRTLPPQRKGKKL